VDRREQQLNLDRLGVLEDEDDEADKDDDDDGELAEPTLASTLQLPHVLSIVPLLLPGTDLRRATLGVIGACRAGYVHGRTLSPRRAKTPESTGRRAWLQPLETTVVVAETECLVRWRHDGGSKAPILLWRTKVRQHTEDNPARGAMGDRQGSNHVRETSCITSA
jgi:hypothetical protein